MKRFFTILIISALAGCAKKTVPAIEADGTSLSLAVDESATYSNLSITVTAIRESRCPMNARCIRAGEAVANLMISNSKGSAAISLCTGADCERQKLSDQGTVTLGTDQYQFSLEDIVPNPAKTLEKSVHKAVFSVKKL